MGQFISLGIFITLSIWGILFLLQKIAVANMVNAELGLIAPLVLLFFISWQQFAKRV